MTCQCSPSLVATTMLISVALQKQMPSLFARVILKNFANFTGKHLCWSLLFNKVASQKPPALLKNRIQHRYFPVKFVKTFKKTYFYITPLVAASDLRNF